MNKTNSKIIIIKDPLYKQILLDKKYLKIIDSKPFQRLRHIKQTSFVDFVYPSANHTRFSHSIGAAYLMNKVLNNGLMKVDKKTKEDLILAALLHDIAHGPFSHFWEKNFPNFDHEKSAKEILKQFKLDRVIKILNKESEFSYLISSTIDVDKLDYMARDSYFTGVSYGVAEVDFIIEHMYIKDKKLVIKKSAISSVEDLITQRINLFKTVYFHKFSIGFDVLVSMILKRVKDLYKSSESVFLNEDFKAFFTGTNTIENLLNVTDATLIYHIEMWRKSKDEILSKLSCMFFNREKFKVINLEYEKVNLKKLKKAVSKKYDVRYYYKEVSLPIKIIQTPIYVEIDNKLKKLEDILSLIKFYKKQNWSVNLVVFPRDIDF